MWFTLAHSVHFECSCFEIIGWLAGVRICELVCLYVCVFEFKCALAIAESNDRYEYTEQQAVAAVVVVVVVVVVELREYFYIYEVLNMRKNTQTS